MPVKLENLKRLTLLVGLVVVVFVLSIALIKRTDPSDPVSQTGDESSTTVGLTQMPTDTRGDRVQPESDQMSEALRPGNDPQTHPSQGTPTDLAYDWRKQSKPAIPSSRNALARLRAGRTDKAADREAEEEEREREQAAAGLKFRTLSLRDENGEIAVDGLAKARAQIEAMKAARDEKAKASKQDPDKMKIAGLDPSSWAWIGPGNVGGRVRSIVTDPSNANNLIVGSVSGGIWRSDDTGNTWAPVDDFMASLAVSSIVRNPMNPDVLYAGTGEGFAATEPVDNVGFSPDGIRGLGVFQSMDGGSTWTQLPNTNPGNAAICPAAGINCPWSYVNRLAISPDGSTILAATAAGIWWSADAGMNWNQAVGFNGIAWDIDFHPTDSQLAVSGVAGAAYFSTNGGQNWSQATTPSIGGRVELAYAPSSPSTVYASVNQNMGEVYVSTNGGQNYSQVNTGTNLLGGQGEYGNIVWVNPLDPSFVVVGGVALFRSTDGGQNFTPISTNSTSSAHSDHHAIVAATGFNNSSNKSVYFGNDGGVFRADDVSTVDLTDGWTHRNHFLGVTQFYGGAATPTGTIFGGTQDNGTVRAVPDGAFNPPYNSETWDVYLGGDGGFVAADPTDANYMYSEYINLGIQRSSDGGSTGSYIYCNPPPSSVNGGVCTGTGILDAFNGANFIAPFILDPNNANRLLAGGLSLWRSNDIKNPGQPSWAVVKPQVLATPPPPPPGPTPTPTPTPTPPPVPISAIAVADGNPDFIVVGHNDGQMYLSQQGTNSPPNDWAPIHNGTPSRFVTRLAIDISKNPYWIYATFGGFRDGNIQRTTDLGATWTDVSGAGMTSLPLVPVRSITINPADTDRLYVGTEVGIFASEDAGATWLLPQGGPANVSVDELFWFAGDLFAATHGRGMYKTHVPVLDTASCGVNPIPTNSCGVQDCPGGQVKCPGSSCGCCDPSDWNCPCAWNNQQVPGPDSDVVVACPMTLAGGLAKNVTVSPGAGLTFTTSNTSLHTLKDLKNFGFIRANLGLFGIDLAADRDFVNARPQGAVSTRGVIQLKGSILVGGKAGNYGIIALDDQFNAKGLDTDANSTLTFSRMTIEGDVHHLGLIQENGLASFQSFVEFKSPPGFTSTFSGDGTWTGPRGRFAPGSSFALASDVVIGLTDFRFAGTLTTLDHQFKFTGNTLTNDPGSLANGLGVLGTGVVNIAPASGSATFVSGRREVPQEVQFTPQLQISNGNVIVEGAVSGVLVKSGAHLLLDFLNVGGDMTVEATGSVESLGGGTIMNFNGSTLTNNGAINDVFFLNFNRSGVPLDQTVGGTGTWSPRNVQLGLYPPSTSTTSLLLDNDLTFSTSSLIVSQGSTLRTFIRTLTLAGPTNLVNDGSITGPNGRIKMQATGAGGRVGSIPGATFLPTLEIASGIVRVNPTSAAFALSGNLQINSGATFQMTGPELVTLGNVSNNGAINILPGTPFAVLNPRGPGFANNGTVSGTNLIVKFGAGAGGPFTHQLSGTGSWSAMEQLLVNTGSTLELLNDVTYSGNSLFLLGSLNTLTNTLTLPCTTSWAGPGEAFGTIRRTNLAACSGPLTFGNPFTSIQFTSGTLPTEISVNVSPMAPVGFPSAVTRSFLITPTGGSGYTATLRLHYLDSELNGNSEAGLNLFRNNGTSWNLQGATSRNATDNWVEYAGVTAFSPWAISSAAPTAASTSLSGRVYDASGSGVSQAVVTISNGQGFVHSTRTNSFGNYVINGIAAGGSYVVSVVHRSGTYSPRVVLMSDNVAGFDFEPDKVPFKLKVH